MSIRMIASVLALSALSLGAGAAASLPTQPGDGRPPVPAIEKPMKGDRMKMHAPSADMQQCLTICGECAAVCAQTSHHCLGLGGDHASQNHQVLLQDCTSICATSACFMCRTSPHSADVCRMCADICTKCAAECDRVGKGDSMMTKCAETCRKCAQSCEKMASTPAAGAPTEGR